VGAFCNIKDSKNKSHAPQIKNAEDRKTRKTQ